MQKINIFVRSIQNKFLSLSKGFIKKNSCIFVSLPSYQTFHKKCFSRSSEVVFYLEEFSDPRWLPWPLIGWDNFNFLSRFTACEVARLAINVPLWVLKKCCCFSDSFEILHAVHGCPSFCLVETFFTFFFSKTT